MEIRLINIESYPRHTKHFMNFNYTQVIFKEVYFVENLDTGNVVHYCLIYCVASTLNFVERLHFKMSCGSCKSLKPRTTKDMKHQTSLSPRPRLPQIKTFLTTPYRGVKLRLPPFQLEASPLPINNERPLRLP